jgi:5-methylcytosine-specific restriction endonuclease McrA
MSNSDHLRYNAETRTVQDLVNLYQNGHLNLEPDFQRDSVWSDRDRAKLIDSVLKNYPVPALFLHKREQNGVLYYDVIDGKQRLETFFRFMGILGKRFNSKTVLFDDHGEELVDWPLLKKRQLQPRLTGYNLQVIFVEGELGPIIDLFVRINSTGRALSQQEKRHAKFYRSEFFKKAARLAESEAKRLLANHVLSANQISRMKHVELVSEIMLSCHYGDVIHKKQILEQAMSDKGLPAQATTKAHAAAKAALNRTFRIFPNLRQTRFVQLSDFYSLVVLVHKLEREHCRLNLPSRNRVAWVFLSTFGRKVDQLRELYKKGAKIPQELELYRSYLQTVTEGTDTSQHRKLREKALRELLESQFKRKDKDRIFSGEQRRIIWNLTKDHRCAYCRKELTWGSFTVDHVTPHSKGGKTVTLNAALMHHACNAKKGAG